VKAKNRPESSSAQNSDSMSAAPIDSGAQPPSVGLEAEPSSGDRHARIAEAAYRRAHARNFEPGGELDDWLNAEREINGE
jgi:hypothetical protein